MGSRQGEDYPVEQVLVPVCFMVSHWDSSRLPHRTLTGPNHSALLCCAKKQKRGLLALSRQRLCGGLLVKDTLFHTKMKQPFIDETGVAGCMCSVPSSRSACLLSVKDAWGPSTNHRSGGHGHSHKLQWAVLWARSWRTKGNTHGGWQDPLPTRPRAVAPFVPTSGAAGQADT